MPEELIRQEEAQIACDPRWKSIADEGERAKHIRTAAERAAQDKTLLSQEAARDTRPVDAALLAQHVARLKQNGGCRSAFDDTAVRQVVEHSLRVERLTREMVESAPKPTSEEIETFFQAHRENFRLPEMFHAAHIVKHVNEEQTEEQAEAGIQAALAETWASFRPVTWWKISRLPSPRFNPVSAPAFSPLPLDFISRSCARKIRAGRRVSTMCGPT